MSSNLPHWRPMMPDDLPTVLKIADQVHPDFPEEHAIFAERLSLYPAGSYVLGRSSAVTGYLLSHPWHSGKPPVLNSLLGGIPPGADRYYIHDLALLSTERGAGMAGVIIKRIAAHAIDKGFPAISLIAVNGSIPFWSGFGFVVDDSAGALEQVRSYDDDARLMVRKLA